MKRCFLYNCPRYNTCTVKDRDDIDGCTDCLDQDICGENGAENRKPTGPEEHMENSEC